MAKEYSRAQRVGDVLKRELASLIQKEIRDPRIGMVSVIAVEVSRDLSYAKVYVTVMGEKTEKEAAESIATLNRAAGFLRRQMAYDSCGRTTPKLQFCFDSSVERGHYLSTLIDKATC